MKERTSPGAIHCCGEPGAGREGRGCGAEGWLPPLTATLPGCPASASEDGWTDSEADSSCSGQPIHLWQFLKELLLKPHSYGRFIRWLNKEKGEPGSPRSCSPPLASCQAQGWGGGAGRAAPCFCPEHQTCCRRWAGPGSVSHRVSGQAVLCRARSSTRAWDTLRA